MKKLTITNKMSMDEQRARMIINDTIAKVKNENDLRKWLLDQVTGVEIDGITYTYAWLTYERALGYFEEATR